MATRNIKYFLSGILIAWNFTLQAQFITNNGIAINNSALIVTNGSWANDAGTSILNNGTIRISESFTNDGVLEATGIGGFALLFAADMNFKPGGSQMGFLTKDGAGAALVTGTISVKDSLLLKNGILRLINATDTASVRAEGILSANASSYVEGLVARAGTGELTFPIGRSGVYLPLRLYRVNAKKITASVIPAPPGYTAGPGLDSLINFPYAWKVQEKIKADTAAYVEVNYPNTLPVGANPIIARETAGQKYTSMGARFVSNTSGRVTVRSYSKRLNGMYTVAAGFPADLVTDSLALVALYNSAGGASWTTKTNWIAGDIDTWSGVTVNGQSITALNLAANKITGAIPDAIVDINALQTINLSGNSITAIPDFTANLQVTTLNVANNRLDFASLEPNASVPGLNYAGQAELGTASDELVPVGSPVQFTVNAGGASSQYLWKRNGQTVSGATSPVYAVASIDRTNMGEYVAEVTNPLLPGLTLKSPTQKTLAYAGITGKLFAEPTVGASKGVLTLFRITASAYDTIRSVQVQNDGSFNFEKVVLDDYQLLGFADTLTYARALPTYYTNTIFWEEADTLFLENDLNNLEIISDLKPLPTSGRGSISGTLEEDDGIAGRKKETQRAKRVGGAGATVRRVERTGRGKEEILTLVAHVFTDENGEFILPNLPTGEYRLNIQYPGYPMDETSYITIPIGTGLQSQVSVEANVVDGKINVRKRIITGIDDTENYSADIYPNPAIDFIRMSFSGNATGRVVSIIGANGKTLMAAKAEEKETTISVQQFIKGIYFLHVKEKGVILKTFKVSIE